VVAVITIIVAGIALIVIVALVVPIVDAIQAPTWRQIARERRQNWEDRQLQPHGPHDPWPDS
jgi:hypothetical protein